MYKIKHLSPQLWGRKLVLMKRKYGSSPKNQRCLLHLKKTFENNEIYCKVCGKSLKDEIGKNIVINTKVSCVSKWVHISCALDKKLIDEPDLSLIPIVNTQK